MVIPVEVEATLKTGEYVYSRATIERLAAPLLKLLSEGDTSGS